MVNSLTTAYRESVQPRMLGMPVYNAALETEAVGFAWRDGRLCGVLLTPWCMNLVLFPQACDEWEDRAAARTVEVEFPSGSQRCMLSALEGVPVHLSLPLFTTVLDFENQETAREVAREVLQRLYTRAATGGDADPVGGPQSSRRQPRTLTRRELLRGGRVAP